MPAGNDREISVDEAADALAVSAATIRRYCRQEKLDARKVPSAGQQDAWAITIESVQALVGTKRASRKKSQRAAGNEQSLLTSMNSSLQAIEQRLQEQQRALQPSDEERQARGEQQRRIEEALVGNAETIRELGEKLGAVRADRDRLRKELEEARSALIEEKRKSWWRRLTERT